MAASFVDDGFCGVRKACMADVVNQASHPDELPGNGERLVGEFGDPLEVRFKEVAVRRCKLVEGARCNIHHAERVLEAGVCRAWIEHFGQRELADMAQTPEDR